MNVGDKVRIIDTTSPKYNKIGIIVKYILCYDNYLVKIGEFGTFQFNPQALEPYEEPEKFSSPEEFESIFE